MWQLFNKRIRYVMSRDCRQRAVQSHTWMKHEQSSWDSRISSIAFSSSWSFSWK